MDFARSLHKLVVPGHTAPNGQPGSEPHAGGPAPGDPRGGSAPFGTNVTTPSRDWTSDQPVASLRPAGAGLVPGVSPKDGLRVTDRAVTTATPTRGPVLSAPGAIPAGVLSFLPWWLRLAYRLSASVRRWLHDLYVMELV